MTDQADDVRAARLIVLPGRRRSGAGDARARRSAGSALRSRTRGRAARRMLGVCLGMQLLFEASAEGDTPCLGLLPGRVDEIDWARRVPHMGWNDVAPGGDGPLAATPPGRVLLRPLLRRHQAAPDVVAGTTEIAGRPIVSAVSQRAHHRRAVPPREERRGRRRASSRRWVRDAAA